MGCSVLLIVFTWLFYRMSKTVIRSCHVSNYIIFCVDETEAIPLIRPRGRPNPKLYAAVRKLMVCYYSCSNLQHTLPLKRVRARSSVSISTEEAQNYASLWWSAYWPLDKDYLLFESCVSRIFSKRNKKNIFHISFDLSSEHSREESWSHSSSWDCNSHNYWSSYTFALQYGIVSKW